MKSFDLHQIYNPINNQDVHKQLPSSNLARTRQDLKERQYSSRSILPPVQNAMNATGKPPRPYKNSSSIIISDDSYYNPQKTNMHLAQKLKIVNNIREDNPIYHPYRGSLSEYD